jgi:type II secretory pathway pseudopilin PulG
MTRERGNSKSALTVTELIVVIGILGILIALYLPQISLLQNKSDEPKCIENLRNLYVGFASQATEDASWPQLPTGTKPGSRQEEEYWLSYSSNTLNLSSNLWHCPTIDRAMRHHPPPKGKEPLIHYLPTLFDSRPGTAYKFSGMPWLSEIANVHGHGNLIIGSDGNVAPSVPTP